MSQTEKKPRGVRLSLTRTQLATAVGAELSQLLESTTADGLVEEREVAAIASWLEANQQHGIPAIDHLLPAVRRILADGVITVEERAYLQGEIERVMPPELRTAAKLQRREAAKREREREVEEAIEAIADMDRQAEEERRARGHVEKFDLMVAGVAYDGRADTIRGRMPIDEMPVDLRRMRDNPHDRNAVLITLEDGAELGFVPRDDAQYLAPMLDDGHRHVSTVKKVLDGGRLPIPVIVIDIFTRDNARGVGSPAKEARYRGATRADHAEGSAVNVNEQGSGGRWSWGWLVLLITLAIFIKIIQETSK